MTQPRVHYEVVVCEPSESDPDGYSELACGGEYADPEYTTNKKAVTCKSCLKAMEKSWAFRKDNS